MENSHHFFENKECQYYPCHKEITEMNCLFCFCPLYNHASCPGNPIFIEHNGTRKKCCDKCLFPHRAENYDKIMRKLVL